MSDQTKVGMDWSRPINSMSYMEASQELGEITGDQRSPYWDATNPNHQLAFERVTMLHRHLNKHKEIDPNTPEDDRGLATRLKQMNVTEKDIEQSKVDQEEFITNSNKEKAERELYARFGAEAKDKLAMARHVVGEFLSPQHIAALDQTGLGNDPEFIGLLSQIGDRILEAQKKLGRTPEEKEMEQIVRKVFDEQ